MHVVIATALTASLIHHLLASWLAGYTKKLTLRRQKPEANAGTSQLARYSSTAVQQ